MTHQRVLDVAAEGRWFALGVMLTVAAVLYFVNKYRRL